MATLTGLTRVPDPIDSEQLASVISTTLSKTVSVEITPTEIVVWGANISESDRVAINAAISAYTYVAPAVPVPTHEHTSAAHAHGQADVTNLASDLAGKAASNHNHDASYATTDHTHAPHSHATYTVIPSGTTAMGFGTNTTVKTTPSATATFTTTVPPAGTLCQLIILTSGTVSRTITFGTGFKPVGTLATGTTSARVFVINWISDGTNLYEAGRTAAMVA